MAPHGSQPTRIRSVILAVDDDEGVRDALRAVLGEDFHLLLATDGPAALEFFSTQRIDVVVLDLRLPGMHGLTVLEQMKALDPRVEVIVITGLEEVPPAVLAMKLGASDYLTKPFDERELYGMVERAVRRRTFPTGGALLVGSDLGFLVSLQIILDRQIIAATSVSVDRALTDRAGDAPALVLFDSTRPPDEAVPTVRSLLRYFPKCPFLVMTPDVNRARVLPDFAPLLPWALIAKPCRLRAVLERIGTVLASRGVPRASWARFRSAVSTAIEYVMNHYGEPLRVTQVARASGVSADHLAGLFREALGTSIKDFILRVQVGVACRLLAETDLTIEEIAARCGFDDPSYFSRLFAQFTGGPPGAYRLREAGG